MSNSSDYPDLISVLKTPKGTYKYSIRFKKTREVIRSTKPFLKAVDAWQAAERKIAEYMKENGLEEITVNAKINLNGTGK